MGDEVAYTADVIRPLDRGGYDLRLVPAARADLDALTALRQRAADGVQAELQQVKDVFDLDHERVRAVKEAKATAELAATRAIAAEAELAAIAAEARTLTGHPDHWGREEELEAKANTLREKLRVMRARRAMLAAAVEKAEAAAQGELKSLLRDKVSELRSRAGAEREAAFADAAAAVTPALLRLARANAAWSMLGTEIGPHLVGHVAAGPTPDPDPTPAVTEYEVVGEEFRVHDDADGSPGTTLFRAGEKVPAALVAGRADALVNAGVLKPA